jgi:hypothetical protein
MLINEIEVTKASISFKCLSLENHDLESIFDAISQRGELFNLDNEIPGFHDFVLENSVIRGHYSVVYPFEIEHLVDGLTTKTLFKRIESCEFIITEKIILLFGKNNPAKLFTVGLGLALGENIELYEFDFVQMSRFQDRMLNIKSIVLANPKEKEIRRARLAGHMEDYTEYNIIDPRNHSIESVSGLVETPLGKMTATVGKKGSLRLGVKKGMILTVECIQFVLELLLSESGPGPVASNFTTY